MAKLRPKIFTTTSRVKRDCAECGAPILPGDVQQFRELSNGRRGFTHRDCRGRIELHLGLNQAAYTPAPETFIEPPRCPECGALMTPTAAGGRSCLLAERHANREPVRISAAGWRI